MPVTTVTKVVSEKAHKKEELSREMMDGSQRSSHASCIYSCSLSHISENSTDDIIWMDRFASQLEATLINDNEKGMHHGTTGAPSSFYMDSNVSPRSDCDVSDRQQGEEEHGKENTEVCEIVGFNPPSQINTHLHVETKAVTYVAHQESVEDETQCVDTGLEEALGALVSSLDDYRGQFPQLQLLEQELRLLQVTLKVRMTLL